MSDVRIKTEHEMVLHLRIAELEAALGEATGRIETDGRLIASLEAELDAAEAALDSMTLERGQAQEELREVLDSKHDRIAVLETRMTSLIRYHDYLRSADGPPGIRGGGEPPELKEARAALSPTPSGE